MYFQKLSSKTEYILKVSYFRHEFTSYKLTQHLSIVFRWHLQSFAKNIRKIAQVKKKLLLQAKH